MSDYTYEFPDEARFLYTLRLLLETTGEERLSALLAGARCSFDSYGQFSRRRWNSYAATIIFRVPVENLDKFIDEDEDKLLGFADRMMPPEAGYELMHIDIVPHLHAPPTEETLDSVSAEL